MEKRKKTSAVIRLLILAFIIIGVPALLYVNFRDTLFNTEWLRHLPELLSRYRGHAAAILIALQILQVFVCIIPGQPIQFAASYMFGIFRGFLLSIAGAVIGVSVSFFLAKFLGRDFVELLFDKDKVADYHAKLNSGRGLLIVLLIYLIPGVPKDLVSYVAGISGMKFRPFLIVSTVGRSPGMIGSLLLGHFFSTRNYAAIAVLAVITALILIICFIKRDKMISLLDNLEHHDIQ